MTTHPPHVVRASAESADFALGRLVMRPGFERLTHTPSGMTVRYTTRTGVEARVDVETAKDGAMTFRFSHPVRRPS